MPRIFGNRFGNVSQADGHLDDKKSVYNRFDQYFSTRRTGWFSKVVASGGTEITDGSYKYHVFLSPGTLTVTTGGRVDYLVVGNGGDGMIATPGGGGGGGGVSTGTNYQISSPQSVTVGGPTGSVFGTITAGNGQSASSPSGSGGASGTPNPRSGGTAVSPLGQGGGGGGAGSAGSNATPTSGGPGGNGVAVPWASAPVISPAIPAPINPSWIPAVGTLGYYGGGGGGSGAVPTTPYVAAGGSGGLGGGGRGSTVDPSPFTTIEPNTDGVTYTGGGGGGGSGGGTGLGGTGIVIIRYAI